MKEIKSSIIFLAILVGVLAGIIITAQFDFAPRTNAENGNAELRGMQDSAVKPAKDMESAKAISNAMAWVSARSIPAVVSITVESTRRGGPVFDFFRGWYYPEQTITGTGSGFFVTSDGFMITNNHVVANADKIVVKLADERELQAKIVGTAENLDLAVLKVEGEDFPFLKLADSDIVRIGETVIAIGSPFGYRHTVTSGIVSAQAYVNMRSTQIEDFIQTDAAINPGNSGGPLLNLDAEVIGVNTAISSKSGGFDGISFAIPANIASFAFEALKDGGKIEGGFIGVGIADVSRRDAADAGLSIAMGCLITGVMENGPGAKAGLRKGDIITEVNGRRVRDKLSFYNMIYFRKPGEVVTLKIRREGKDLELKASVGVRGEEAEEFSRNLGPEKLAVHGATVAANKGEEGKGVVVISVDPNTPAARCELEPADIVLSINRKEVNSTAEFEEEFNKAVERDSISLRIVRNGITMMMTLRGGLAGKKEDPDPEQNGKEPGKNPDGEPELW